MGHWNFVQYFACITILTRHALTFVAIHFKRVKNTQLVPAVGFYVKGLFAFFVDDGSTKRSLFVGIKKGMTSC